MEKLLAETVAPAVRGANPHLQTFTFTRVELGEKPLRIIGVKVHPSQRKDQILLDLNVSYVGDVQIDVEVKKYFCKAGVKGMQVGLTSGPFYRVFVLSVMDSGEEGASD